MWLPLFAFHWKTDSYKYRLKIPSLLQAFRKAMFYCSQQGHHYIQCITFTSRGSKNIKDHSKLPGGEHAVKMRFCAEQLNTESHWTFHSKLFIHKHAAAWKHKLLIFCVWLTNHKSNLFIMPKLCMHNKQV